MKVYDADRLVRSFAAVVGKPSTPTPAGLFAIAAELPQPSPGKNFEGAWVLPLTAHSEVLRSFEGGDGQVALHGRGGASLGGPPSTAPARTAACAWPTRRSAGSPATCRSARRCVFSDSVTPRRGHPR